MVHRSGGAPYGLLKYSMPKGERLNKDKDYTKLYLGGTLLTLLLALLVAALLISTESEEPSRVNVRCIGDHLLFESERTGDIQVIPNKCKKTYPKKQAPEGQYA